MKKLKPIDLLKMLNQRDDVFCHVSTNIKKNGFFKPRVPDNLYMYVQEENDEIDRICVAPTLEKALSAIPRGGSNLFDWYEDNGMYFKVFIIDTKKLGIKESSIVVPEYLVKNKYVLDAEQTREHWILEAFEVTEEDSFLINVKDFKIEKDFNILKDLDITTDYVYNNEIIEIDMDYVDYSQGVFEEDLCLHIEKEKLKSNFLKTNPEIEFIDKEDEDKIRFITKKDQSIRKLMEFDSQYKTNIMYDVM